MKIEKFVAKLNDVNILPQSSQKMFKGGDDITTENDLPTLMEENEPSAYVSIQDLTS